MAEIRMRPQSGAQMAFLSSRADIVIYGGAAGGGKTWAMVAEPLRHINNPNFTAAVFRRNSTQIFNPGGLWDEASKLYPHFGAKPRLVRSEWVFPSGAYVKYGHLSEESTVHSYQGAQICLVCFDEATHFSAYQFYYMMSRNRSTCGVRPYIRATCNPDADSWVAQLIDWWIDEEGYPIHDRSGVIRYMCRIDNDVIFADSPGELIDKYGKETIPKSFTFIPSTLYDNKILMETDPGYLANLKGLAKVERERLLYGNWKIRPAAGLYFRKSWISFAEVAPAGLKRVVRYWDLAATEKTPENDPDQTVGVKMGIDDDGRVYVLEMVHFFASPAGVRNQVKNIASYDGRRVWVGIPQDPAQAGKSQVFDYTKLLHGYTIKARAEGGDKELRFSPFSAQCENGNVVFIRGDWNDTLIYWLEGFPDARYKDFADACSGAYALLTETRQPIRIPDSAIRHRRIL